MNNNSIEKTLFSNEEIIPVFIPKRVILNTKQSLGKPSVPKIEEGDIVNGGDVVAYSDGFISSYIHTPIPGRITSINKANDENGLQIQIDYQGTIHSMRKQPDDINIIDDKEIIERIKLSGAIENNDHSIPLYYLFNLAILKKISNIYITANEPHKKSNIIKYFVINKLEKITNSIKIINKLLKPDKITFIGNINIRKHLKKIDQSNIGFKYVKKAPSLSYKANQYRVLSGENKNPKEVLSVSDSYLILSLESLLLLYDAVLMNKPQIEKIIMIQIEGKSKPIFFKTMIGVCLSELLTELEINPNEFDIYTNYFQKLKKIDDLEFPIDKRTSQIILVRKNYDHSNYDFVCNGCNKCIEVCPSGINPRKIYNTIKNDYSKKKCKQLNIDYCIECELCNKYCPANIDLLGKIIEEKNNNG